MDNLEFLYSLFNQYLFQDAKNNLVHLEYYFNSNPSTVGNTLVRGLLDLIKNYDLSEINEPLINSLLIRDRKTSSEQQNILGCIKKWKMYDKQTISPQKELLKDICADSLMRKFSSKIGRDNPYELYKLIKNSEIKLDNSDTLVSVPFDGLDINTMVAESINSIFPSSFQWINELFIPTNMYEGGQIVMITMPPGTGKTLFMMTEALSMSVNCGVKTHYLAMGDMKPKDFIIRMGAIYSGLSFGDTARNLTDVYNALKSVTKDNLSLTIDSAGSIDVDEYIDFVLDNNYKVVFIDYDSNFKMSSSENMYNDFGEVYNKLTKLSQRGILVFIAAQPKIASWVNPEIELGDVGESARKIHTIDILFTAGKFIGSPNHLGIFKCCKNRRGEEGVKTGYIRLNNGRFRFIPVDLAKNLASNPQKRDYTDSDIDKLINEHLSMVQRNQQTQQQISPQSQVRPKINTPFN